MPALRFVLLWHECPAGYRDGSHWDLMLERPDVDDDRRLATWSLPRLPADWPEGSEPQRQEPQRQQRRREPLSTLPATRLPDHRAAYLDYEGPVRGGRGSVRRVAAGEIEWLAVSDRRVEVLIASPSTMAGTLTLERGGDGPWLLTWRG